jgi:hypothetical protein
VFVGLVGLTIDTHVVFRSFFSGIAENSTTEEDGGEEYPGEGENDEYGLQHGGAPGRGIRYSISQKIGNPFPQVTLEKGQQKLTSGRKV